jgi:RimJ/RimL family protein N-acetyltransferase
MPIVTPRLVLRPPTLDDLDSIQAAKEEAWPDLQRWMAGPSTTSDHEKRWKNPFEE